MSTQSDLSPQTEEGLEALRQIWEAQGQTVASIEEACDTPNAKVCRNAVHMTYEGYAEDGEDARDGWRNALAKDGKNKGSSLADLILGSKEER
jgi:hypothetical protein